MEEEGGGAKTERVRVLVRIRPLVALETESETRSVESVVEAREREVVLHGAEARHQLVCTFDTVLGPSSSQEDVYGHVGDCVDVVSKGYNATVLAYGQTGSGKTHTMFGRPGWSESAAGWSGGGLIPRAVSALFEALPKDAQVFASFMQIYREQVYDMLRDAAMSVPLEIHEEALSEGGGTFVSGLSEYGVRSAADCVNLIRAGEANRATRETRGGNGRFNVASTWVFSKQRPRGKPPRFEFAPRDDRSSKNEPKTSGKRPRYEVLNSWTCLTLFLPRRTTRPRPRSRPRTRRRPRKTTTTRRRGRRATATTRTTATTTTSLQCRRRTTTRRTTTTRPP